MLSRISLIIAILAGLGAFGLGHFVVAPKLAELKEQLDTTTKNLASTTEERDKAKKDFKTSKERADKLDKDLAEATANLEATTQELSTQTNRAAKAEADLRKTRGELTESQRDLASWKALGTPVDQVEKKLAELVKANQAIEALGEEKKVMIRNILSLTNRLAKYEGAGADTPPDMPPVKGKVVSVDPKWDFVVLDVGGNQGIVERGELLVNRQGRLVAKVRVTTVEATRAIANVLPEWKQAEVMEGDQVLH